MKYLIFALFWLIPFCSNCQIIAPITEKGQALEDGKVVTTTRYVSLHDFAQGKTLLPCAVKGFEAFMAYYDFARGETWVIRLEKIRNTMGFPDSIVAGKKKSRIVLIGGRI